MASIHPQTPIPVPSSAPSTQTPPIYAIAQPPPPAYDDMDLESLPEHPGRTSLTINAGTYITGNCNIVVVDPLALSTRLSTLIYSTLQHEGVDGPTHITIDCGVRVSGNHNIYGPVRPRPCALNQEQGVKTEPVSLLNQARKRKADQDPEDAPAAKRVPIYQACCLTGPTCFTRS